MFWRFALWVCYELGVLHVPEWDNVEDAWEPIPVVPQLDDPRKTEERPKLETVTNLYGGIGEPGETVKRVTHVVIQKDELEWDYKRYDGSQDSPDLSPWHWTDDEIVRDLTPHKERMYRLVRPHVIAGWTNREIAKEHSKGMSWAETYGAMVRRAFHKRLRLMNSPSPSEGERGR